MDEEEYEFYLTQIDELERKAYEEERLIEQCRDEDGIRVPGCYFVKPAHTEA